MCRGDNKMGFLDQLQTVILTAQKSATKKGVSILSPQKEAEFKAALNENLKLKQELELSMQRDINLQELITTKTK